jgi:predicted NodU family carbamoyl transferase
MADGPIVVGINRTQDGSIAVAAGGSTVVSLQKERISRRKHHRGRLGDLSDRYLPRIPLLAEPVDLVVEGYSSDAEFENLGRYRAELTGALRLTRDARMVLASDHLDHLYSAFYPSPSDRAAGLVVDAAVAAAGDLVLAQRPDDLARAMVDVLERGYAVRLHQGRSESGPPALGNRSIIGDARRPGMQDYINFEVKGREWFRPLAPLVLAEHAQRIFEPTGPRRSCVRRGRAPAVPASVSGDHPRRQQRPGCRPWSRSTPPSCTRCSRRGTSGKAALMASA